MISFSANLGFLWSERDLPMRIRAAADAGFQAVEFHFPYDTPAGVLAAQLKTCGISPVSLNTIRGRPNSSDFGLAAVPGREVEARNAIDQAVTYASAAGIPSIHVLAGLSLGLDGAVETFNANLTYALQRTADSGQVILIEPINNRDAPGYALPTLEDALRIQDQVGDDRLKIMFDCYHLQIMGGDLLRRFAAHRDRIGHVQFASVPNRGEPDMGEVDFRWLLPAFQDAGYSGTFGAEYQPRTTTDAGLGWMRAYR